MANVLITGGAGFVGGNFVRYWRERYPDDEVLVLDNLTYAGNQATLIGIESVELVIGDIRDTGLAVKLLRERSIDILIHFAAESHVDRSIAHPSLTFDTNINGTASLLHAARTVWLDIGGGRPHRFHHVSTDEVFGSLSDHAAPFNEASAYAPNSPYAASKAASDHLVRAYHRTFGLQVTTTNCSNNFGPYQHPEKLVPKFILNALNGAPLTLYGDGHQVRDWIHVLDHCRAIELCLSRGQPGQTYAIGGGTELENFEVARQVCCEVDRLFASNSFMKRRFPRTPAAYGVATEDLISLVADRPGHDRRYAIDGSKAATELGFRPSISFSEGLKATIDWYLANEEWWRID